MPQTLENTVPPKAVLYNPLPETRGYMINLVRNLSPTWLELELERVQRSGFNLVLFPIYNNGWTLYPSDSAREIGMPAINPLFKKWDPLATATRLASEAGIVLWGFVRPYNFHPRFSIAEHRLLRKRSNRPWRMRLHDDYDQRARRELEQWNACPINHEYRRYIGNLLTEVTATYPLEGLVLDFTSFGFGGGSLEQNPVCFCESCRTLYAESQDGDGVLVEDARSQLRKVRRWQQEQIHHNFWYIRTRLRRSRPGIRFMARAQPVWRDFPTTNMMRPTDSALIDWGRLLDERMLEAVIPDHDGENCHPQFNTRLAADYAYLGDEALFLPFLSIEEREKLAPVLADLRRYPVTGFIAELQESLTAEEADKLREEYFMEPSLVVESNPIRSAIVLLRAVLDMMPDNAIVDDLLNDFLRLLEREQIPALRFVTLQVIAENMRGLEQYLRSRKHSGSEIPEGVLRHLGLARRCIDLAGMDVPS